MVQTATHVFILTLEVSSANAPHMQNRQEGTMRSSAGLAFFEGERPEPLVLDTPSRRTIDIIGLICVPQRGEL